MTLLADRDKARLKLDDSVQKLFENHDWVGATHRPEHIKRLKKRARDAKKNLQVIESKLSKIKNHAPSARLEMIAQLMMIFSDDNPEVRKQIESVVTFT